MEPTEYERIYRHEASHYWYRGLHALVLASLRRHLRPAGRPEILDAGCGAGGLSARLSALGRVTALDLSPLALEFAARRIAAGELRQARLLRGSIERLPLQSGSFDAVVCADVLYHRAVSDDAAALAELARVCRPGGLVLLNLAAHDWLRGAHDAQVHTARRHGRGDVRRMASAAGLEIVRVSWFNCALLPAAMLVRKFSRARAGGGGPAGGAAHGPAPASDLRPLPALLNAPLSAWMHLEAAASVRGLLPWGLSLNVVLRRPHGGRT
ncbi:MAG: class I SAM-dependent methyltransferase [Planctomycetota bacterium]